MTERELAIEAVTGLQNREAPTVDTDKVIGVTAGSDQHHLEAGSGSDLEPAVRYVLGKVNVSKDNCSLMQPR